MAGGVSHRVLLQRSARGFLVVRSRIWENLIMMVWSPDERAAVDAACARFGVARLQVFGSAVTERFDPARSDVDFLVEFLPGRQDRFSDYFGLSEALRTLMGREIDLVSTESLDNPFFRATVLASAEELYAA